MEFACKPALTDAWRHGANRYFSWMKHATPFAAVVALLSAAPAHAIVGGGAPPPMASAAFHRHHRRLARQFLHRQLIAPKIVLTAAHCVQPGADYRIVDYSSGQPPLQDVQKRRHPSRVQDGCDAGASRHRRCRAAAARSSRRRARRRPCLACQISRSPSAAASPSPVSASPCAATARAAAPFASPALLRPASPARCRSAWSIPSARARATGSAPAPAIPAPGVRGQARRPRHHRRRQLVDGAERQRRLRRHDRRHAAHALPRLGFADRAAMGSSPVSLTRAQRRPACLCVAMIGR